MALPNSKFKTLAVRQYLANKFPYAAQCFAQDFRQEMVDSMEVAVWFKSYFPRELAIQEFRNLECQAAQYVQLERNK